MLTTIVLGIAASLYVEAIKLLDRKLIGTVAQGYGAFILSFGAAFLAACVKVALFDRYEAFRELITALWTTLSQIWLFSQVYYQLIAKTFGLRVTPPSSSDPIL